MKPTQNEGIIAIDNGGSSTNVKTATSFVTFPSEKGEIHHDFRLNRNFGSYDFLMELFGKRYAGGTLAEEASFPLQMHTESKQHIFYDLSILTAIHRYGFAKNYVVTCVPIFMHTPEEKEGLRNRLCREWHFRLNGETKQFTIEDVAVVPETVTAFWVDTPKGKTRWVDWGSRTVGYGTTINQDENMRFLNKESGTFNKKGLEAVGIDNNPRQAEALADFIGGRLLSQWDKDDKVIHLGGGALNQNITFKFSEYFPNSEVMKNPKKANVEGMYILGRSVFNRA